MSETDARFMAAALAIGRRGQGRTAPNPPVGAVVTRDTSVGPVIVGLGRTGDGGRPHAEPLALVAAGAAAEGGTLYVTLEPCSHYGRSPPCTDAIIASRVSRVVAALADPNPLVACNGFAALTAHGIRVSVGLRAAEAARDLSGHISRMTRGRPHVAVKLALSADGAIGRRGAGQVAITGKASRRRTHVMRAESDAIAVGVGTVLADDPDLTCRLPGMAARSPMRVVFDSAARTPPTARLFERAVAVLVLVSEAAPAERTAALVRAGATVQPVPAVNGRIDLSAALAALSGMGVTRLMVEGGAVLADSLAGADLVDEWHIVEAPTRIGGDRVVPLGGRGLDALVERFAPVALTQCGPDRWHHLVRRGSPGTDPVGLTYGR